MSTWLDGTSSSRTSAALESSIVRSTGIFHVQAYGAVDDTGASSSLTAIRAAIVAANAAGGGVVFIPEGTFLINGTLELEDDVHLCGAGMHLTTLKADPSIADDAFILGQTVDRVIVSDLSIDGNRSARSTSYTGGHNLVFYGSLANPNEYIMVERVRSYASTTQGMKFNYCHFLTIRDCIVQDTRRDGVVVEYDSKDVVVDGLTVHGVGDDALAFNRHNASADETGVVLERIVVNNLIVYDQGAANTLGGGLKFHGVLHGTASNIVINRTYGSGIVVVNSQSDPCQYVDISNFVVNDAGYYNTGNNGGHGIFISGAHAETSQINDAGVYDIRISNGRVVNARANGIRIFSSNSDGPVERVDISNVSVADAGGLTGATSTSLGILASGTTISDISVNNVLIERSAGGGIRVGDGSNTVQRTVLNGVRSYDNGQFIDLSIGVQLSATNNPTITFCSAGNRTGTTQGVGIAVFSPTGTVNYLGNTYFSNTTSETSFSGTARWTTDVGQRAYTQSSTSPSSGTWERGDVCWNTAPTSGSVPGWMCTTAGAPGTWTAMANLT